MAEAAIVPLLHASSEVHDPALQRKQRDVRGRGAAPSDSDRGPLALRGRQRALPAWAVPGRRVLASGLLGGGPGSEGSLVEQPGAFFEQPALVDRSDAGRTLFVVCEAGGDRSAARARLGVREIARADRAVAVDDLSGVAP